MARARVFGREAVAAAEAAGAAPGAGRGHLGRDEVLEDVRVARDVIRDLEGGAIAATTREEVDVDVAALIPELGNLDTTGSVEAARSFHWRGDRTFSARASKWVLYSPALSDDKTQACRFPACDASCELDRDRPPGSQLLLSLPVLCPSVLGGLWLSLDCRDGGRDDGLAAVLIGAGPTGFDTTRVPLILVRTGGGCAEVLRPVRRPRGSAAGDVPRGRRAACWG